MLKRYKTYVCLLKKILDLSQFFFFDVTIPHLDISIKGSRQLLTQSPILGEGVGEAGIE